MSISSVLTSRMRMSTLSVSSMEMLSPSGKTKRAKWPCLRIRFIASLFPTWNLSFGQPPLPNGSGIEAAASRPEGREGSRAQVRCLPGPLREQRADCFREGLHVEGHPEKEVCADPDGDVLVEKLGREGRRGDDGPPVDALEMPDQHESLDEAVGLEVAAPMP